MKIHGRDRKTTGILRRFGSEIASLHSQKQFGVATRHRFIAQFQIFPFSPSDPNFFAHLQSFSVVLLFGGSLLSDYSSDPQIDAQK